MDRERPDKTPDTVHEVTQQRSSSNTSQDDDAHAQHEQHQYQDLSRIQSHTSHVVYRVYRRRWFGLAQIVLLNIIISWDVSTHGPQFFAR